MRPWTDAHERTALRRIYEIAGEAAETIGDGCAASIADAATWSAASEAHFRDGLAEAKLDHARIDREVRRVRARAEGRETVTVEEPFFRVRHPNGWYEHKDDGMPPTPARSAAYRTDVGELADQMASHTPGARVVRVTVTRRRRAAAPR